MTSAPDGDQPRETGGEARVVRLSMKVPASVAHELKRLAKEQSQTVTQTVIDAIATEVWARNLKRKGQRLIITDEDGSNEREVLVLR